MTSNDRAAERAVPIPDLGELADRIDVVLAHEWIDRGAFLRDTLDGLRLAVEALPPGLARDELAELAEGISGVLGCAQADRGRCLRGAREALRLLAESAGAELRAAADRAAWVAGLRDLADFLAGHPDLPVPPAHHTDGITVFPDGGTGGQRRAAVDRAAALLGVQAAETPRGHYRAERCFGPVEYRAVVLPCADPASGTAAELAGVA